LSAVSTRFSRAPDNEAHLEVGADVSQLSLQEQEDVLVVFSFLVGLRVQTLGEGLETADLLVQRGEILLDDESQLCRVSNPCDMA